MALVNRGNIYLTDLKLPDLACNAYMRACLIYENNEIAHLNLALMHTLGTSPFLVGTQAEGAALHMRRAIDLGRHCLNGNPNCQCLVKRHDYLTGGSTAYFFDRFLEIRKNLAEGGNGIPFPVTTDLSPENALRIENAVSHAFGDLTQADPIEYRLTRVASAIATLGDYFSENPADDVQAVLEGFDFSSQGNELVSCNEAEMQVDHDRCRALYGETSIKSIVTSLHLMMDEIVDLLDENRTQPFPIIIHAVKTVMALVNPAWRQGILHAAANGWENPKVKGIRVAIPYRIG